MLIVCLLESRHRQLVLEYGSQKKKNPKYVVLLLMHTSCVEH
jgi:hypothetical protein